MRVHEGLSLAMIHYSEEKRGTYRLNCHGSISVRSGDCFPPRHHAYKCFSFY